MPKARAYAQKALELDSSLVEVHSSLAFISLFYDYDFAAAGREFAKAAEHPSDLAVVRSIEPATLDLVEWIRATGWTAPTNVAGF